MGAEGLDVLDGVHLLLADDPDAMATACERLLTDLDLRQRIVDAAEQRYLERYESSVARERVRRLATEVGEAGTDGG
jgi:glycosyltransferase involved in cell wall biosynthesis